MTEFVAIGKVAGVGVACAALQNPLVIVSLCS